MFSYYLQSRPAQLGRNPVLTTLMVMTLAVGVAASMSTLTVLRAMSGDPIPHKSERLFVVQVDNYPADTEEGEDPADHLSWLDAKELLRAGDGLRRSAMYAVGGVTELQDGSNQLVSGMAVTRDFFAMFEVPFRFGGGRSAEADTRGADEVVLSDAFSRRLFGETDPTGKTLRVMGRDRTIVGVLDAWQPLPKYYWLVGGSNRFGETRRIGWRVQDVGFGKGLELTHPEQMHLHPELVLQTFAVVGAVTTHAFQQHRPTRMQVNLVGMRGEVVTALIHAVGVGDDLLAKAALNRFNAAPISRRLTIPAEANWSGRITNRSMRVSAAAASMPRTTSRNCVSAI